jgi:hypothetical protein
MSEPWARARANNQPAKVLDPALGLQSESYTAQQAQSPVAGHAASCQDLVLTLSDVWGAVAVGRPDAGMRTPHGDIVRL